MSLPVLNPCIRLSWFDQHWDKNYVRDTKKQIIDVVGFVPHQMLLASANLNTDASVLCTSVGRISGGVCWLRAFWIRVPPKQTNVDGIWTAV